MNDFKPNDQNKNITEYMADTYIASSDKKEVEERSAGWVLTER
jgi:hypothetical protein